jgi:hypothetical protein
MMRRWTLGTVMPILATLLYTGAAPAATPSTAVCALQQAAACGAVEACDRMLPAGVNLPALMRLDVAAGVIESRADDGAIRKSKIASSSTAEGALVLQGIDGGHAWAMRVDERSGEFTLSVLRDGEAFIGFGVCSAKILE